MRDTSHSAGDPAKIPVVTGFSFRIDKNSRLSALFFIRRENNRK
ncbi:hypothetical protein X965_07225 [Morganella sp. EGD-HP17]|nr:hypothetical protein X965_07225 [Morganella sp. EGD-HP17]